MFYNVWYKTRNCLSMRNGGFRSKKQRLVGRQFLGLVFQCIPNSWVLGSGGMLFRETGVVTRLCAPSLGSPHKQHYSTQGAKMRRCARLISFASHFETGITQIT